MKWTVAKWLTQFTLSCLLSFVLFMCLLFLLKVRARWVVLVIMPIASTLGIVLGDLSLYKNKRLSIFTLSVTYCLGFVGLVIGMMVVGKVFWEELFPTSPGESFCVLYLVSILGLIVPALIGYNGFYFVKRRLTNQKQ